MRCPRCNVIHDSDALRCECGYDFVTRQFSPPPKTVRYANGTAMAVSGLLFGWAGMSLFAWLGYRYLLLVLTVVIGLAICSALGISPSTSGPYVVAAWVALGICATYYARRAVKKAEREQKRRQALADYQTSVQASRIDQTSLRDVQPAHTCTSCGQLTAAIRVVPSPRTNSYEQRCAACVQP